MRRPIATGETRLLGIVGDPIAQVRAPEVWSALFMANGLNQLCVPLHVRSEDLDDFLSAAATVQNLAGVIVTIPHKGAALKHVKYPTDRAELTGAVNVMRRTEDGAWAGDALDGVGFVAALAVDGHDVAGLKALVVGSGGVGTSIAIAIAQAKAREVGVFDVDGQRAQELCRRIRSMGVASSVVPAAAQGFDLIVNASPVGMREGDPLPIDIEGLHAGVLVGDVVVRPGLTDLLAAAAEIGCHVQPGARMMEAQLTHMADFFGFAGTGDWSPDAVARALR